MALKNGRQGETHASNGLGREGARRAAHSEGREAEAWADRERAAHAQRDVPRTDNERARPAQLEEMITGALILHKRPGT